MGTYYTVRLRAGFEISVEDVIKQFRKTSSEVVREAQEGVFHMEDRYDPKTGVKLDPVQVWDVKPVKEKKKIDSWLEIDGNKIADEEDMELLVDLLKNKLNCNVEYVINVADDLYTFEFYPHKKGNHRDYGKVEVEYLWLDYFELIAMKDEFIMLSTNLKNLGFDVGNPKIFVSTMAS
jgi:hypothetical protein